MQLNNTINTITIDNMLYAAELAQQGAKLGYGLAATAYGAAREFGPGLIDRTAIALITAGIYTIRMGRAARCHYDTHLAEQVEDGLYAIAFVALVIFACLASFAITAYRVAAPIVRRQWEIQVADLRDFHRAVSGRPQYYFDPNISEAIARQDALLAELIKALL